MRRLDSNSLEDTALTKLVMKSPLGLLTCVATPKALVGLYQQDNKANHLETISSTKNHPVLIETKKQLDAYFEQRLHRFTLPLKTSGTPFRERVWQALLEIPYGETCSYQDIAQKIGKPKASRAVGMANHHNPIGIIIPCHRVVGKNKKLTGYAGGLENKERLLTLEQSSF